MTDGSASCSLALLHAVVRARGAEILPLRRAVARASDEEYFKLMGYVKAEEQGDAPPETPKLENTDTFCLRLRGFMLFYASYAQADHARHPHGLPAAWAWLSRLLNKVPPNRFSATALEAFLKHAGFAMHAAYGRQFGKLLDAVDREFLPSLEAKDDADARPVARRTRTYLNERGFLNPPRGTRDARDGHLVHHAIIRVTSATEGRSL